MFIPFLAAILVKLLLLLSYFSRVQSVRPHRRQPTWLSCPWIPQARTLEWVAISFLNAWKWKVKVKSFSRVRLLATPWTAAHQAPPSMGFFRQEYWSGVSLPSLYFGHMSTLNILECSWYKNLHGEIFWMLSNSILYWDNWIPFSPLPHVYIRYFKVFWIVCQNTAFVEY